MIDSKPKRLQVPALRRWVASSLTLLLTLFAVSVLSFLLVALLPGDVATTLLGDSATPERSAELRKELGLDQPLPRQYGTWLGKVMQGDLGQTFNSGEAISDMILARVPVTLELILLTQLLALAIAIPLGVWTAYKAGSVFDRLSLSVSLALLSMPTFVFALLLVYAVALKVPLLPSNGYAPLSDGLWANLRHMVLPVTTLALMEVPVYMRLLRSEMLTTLQQNFILLAKGMGLSLSRTLFQHALRPSSLSLITLVGLNMGRLMGGALIIETMFVLPGVGLLLVESIFQQEYLLTQAIVLFVAVAFILINTLTDWLYAWVDPRLKH
ncbi:peptide ABC transporter [Comamonas serinivorans]|uniref:Peptide ABC transporter n=1 Tax=Comamonas serinivorans TaxID=1082851 RepID=A0A1Y0EPP4_9BURK|nr:ABC transporter permease [Comamonas serinivorans]ARU05546.1 peptide ABC transporter [Comamonas serinivorans]